jgi:hypothetical protein
VVTITSEAGKDKSISLEAPKPIYGSLEIKETNVKANIFIDGENRGTTPVILNRILVGSHNIELQAEGYKPHQQTVRVEEGKILPVSAELEEEEKTGTPGKNEIYGELKKKSVVNSVWLLDYRMSPPTSYFGLSLGYCKKWGGYVQYRSDLLQVENTSLTESMLKDVDENFSGGEKKYFRSSITAGGMLRLFSFMYIYGGLGYGKYGAVYKAKMGKGSSEFYTSETFYNDAFYTAGLIKGLELEYGITFRVWDIAASVGYSTIAGSNFGELHFGVGVMLGKIIHK